MERHNEEVIRGESWLEPPDLADDADEDEDEAKIRVWWHPTSEMTTRLGVKHMKVLVWDGGNLLYESQALDIGSLEIELVEDREPEGGEAGEARVGQSDAE